VNRQQRDQAREIHAQGASIIDFSKQFGVTWDVMKGWLVEDYTEYRRLRYGRGKRKRR